MERRNKVRGEKVLLKIVDPETNLVIAGQRTASLDLSADALDATTKESNGWIENEVGLRSWSVSADGLYVRNDRSHRAIINHFLNREKIDVILEQDTGSEFDLSFRGTAVITSYPLEMPYDDLIGYSIDLEGDGALEIIDKQGQIPSGFSTTTQKEKAEVKKQ